jgi:serine protease inhibitor
MNERRGLKVYLPMGKSGWLFARIGISVCLLGSANAAEIEKLSSGNNAFAFALAKELVKEKPGENVFISPYSISAALQMVRAGAAGQTRAEMDHVLGVGGASGDGLAQAYKELDGAIRGAASNAVLNVANAIWFAPNVELKPDFSSLNDQYYGAKLSPLDFTDPRASGVVNRWVEEATHGKIKQMIEGPMSGMTGAFLCNAIYFKGTWEKQFNPQETQDRPFHLAYGQQKPVPMMRQKRNFEYNETDTFQAARLAYAGSRLAMYVFLPGTNSTPQKLVEEFGVAGWEKGVVPKFAKREGTLQMPRFKMEYKAELKTPLIGLGMRRAFRAGAADFSAMTSTPLFVDAVKHKSFVEVNEEGTEAAAATGVTMKMTAVGPGTRPFQMIVDRPYLFVIEDQPSHTILFLGEVLEP